MVNITPSNKMYVSESTIPNAGRGVFALSAIKKDDVIEICPVIRIEEPEVKFLRKTELRNYYFMWGEGLMEGSICLGFGSIYNHSYSPNATYVKNIHNDTIEFVAIKDIRKDEEITVNYNFGNPNDKRTLWIKSIKPAE